MPDLDTTILPLLPLSTGVVLPAMVVTMALESDEAKVAVDAALAGDGRLLLVPRIDARYARVGTIAKVEDSGELPSGSRAVVVRGLERGVIGAGVSGSGTALWVQVDAARETEPTERSYELAREYRAVVENILEERGARQLAEALRGITDPGAMADTAGYSPDLTLEQKIELLETVDVEKRLEQVLTWARDTLADLALKERIRHDVSDGLEKTQREFLLRQQLAAIRKELGEGADGEGVVEQYRSKLADADLPQDVRVTVEREVDRLERTNEQSPEHGWIRTWLDTVTEVPWGKRSDDHLDVIAARAILDADHNGLEDVKDRIIEYLAVRKLRADRGLSPTGGKGAGAIIALVGPPGVGKTSLGESVARALGRSFVRVSLGGVRDEAEIRGHRRTYVGAQPGRVVRALREAGTMNPVFMLDEVDKLGADWRGDPSSALLEVLDPAQNHTFRDHYLEVDLDLSDVLFIATANVADTIPGPLLDRMEVIHLDGYTEDEKVAIATDHLLARQLDRNGLTADEATLTEAAVRAVVVDYTREAGVRNLERELGKVLRKVATKLAAGDAVATKLAAGDTVATKPAVVVDADDVRSYLGRARYFFEAADRTAVPGVATGLAVTGAGGDVLFIEATALPGGTGSTGQGGLTLTGQLGDVMKESAEIALSYIRSHARELDLDDGLSGSRFHVHVPAGAVPKDGPSAGVTMVAALASLLSGRPVRSSVGMTGEVTLQGRVLAIGGGQAEGPGRPPGRSAGGDPARPQRARSRRRPRGHSRHGRVPSRRRCPPSPGRGPGVGGGGGGLSALIHGRRVPPGSPLGSQTMRRVLVPRTMVATMALATVLAGCGGGGSAKPVTAPTTVAAVPPSSGPDGDTFCSLIKEYSNRLGNLSQASSTPDQIRQLARDVHSAIQSALGVAPGDIKSDATVVAGAADDYLAALKDAGYDLAKVPPDALQRFQAPDVSTSAARLQVYSQDVCHTRS